MAENPSTLAPPALLDRTRIACPRHETRDSTQDGLPVAHTPSGATRPDRNASGQPSATISLLLRGPLHSECAAEAVMTGQNPGTAEVPGMATCPVRSSTRLPLDSPRPDAMVSRESRGTAAMSTISPMRPPASSGHVPTQHTRRQASVIRAFFLGITCTLSLSTSKHSMIRVFSPLHRLHPLPMCPAAFHEPSSRFASTLPSSTRPLLAHAGIFPHHMRAIPHHSRAFPFLLHAIPHQLRVFPFHLRAIPRHLRAFPFHHHPSHNPTRMIPTTHPCETTLETMGAAQRRGSTTTAGSSRTPFLR